MKVKCIDANGYAKGKLVNGKVYEVHENLIKYYVVTTETSGREGFDKKRFEVVEDDAPAKMVVDYAINTAIPSADPEEDRMWERMRPRVDPGHCVCGIPKQLCDYHR